jgi:ABC-type branched-subunit amino acid transport system ATPase component
MTSGPQTPSNAMLAVTGATKRFGGVTAALDVSLTVAIGTIHGLIGPNGAGKSTVIGLISGFIKPDSGDIRFDDRDLTALKPADIAQLGVARTFQQATPFGGLTVLENVMVGMHTRYRATITSVLFRTPRMRRENAEITRAAHRLLEEFDLTADADVDAAGLPFGKLRFLEIARAVAMRPRVLLLDEPAAGLNSLETERLGILIRRLAERGTGILLVDHDVPFVFGLCDRMTVMNFGSVIATGDPAKVFHNPAVHEAYLGTPAEMEAAV